MYEKIFPFEDSEKCTCHIVKYSITQSGMQIEVNLNKKRLFYLYFHGIKYFSGPMAWSGANFEVGSAEECQNILLGIDFPEKGIEMLLEKKWIALYLVNTGTYRISLVARNVEKIDASEPL